MAGIKAEWRLAELDLDADDPFDTMILSTGLSVDLTGSAEEIHAALRQTVRMEGRLFDRAVTCDLKDNGTDCRECAEFARVQDIVALCHLGRDQQVLAGRAEDLNRERNRPWRTLGRAFYEASLAERYPDLAARLLENENDAFRAALA